MLLNSALTELLRLTVCIGLLKVMIIMHCLF